MPKSAKISLLAVSVVVLLGLFLGANWRGVHAAGEQAAATAYNQINVYGEVLEHIQDDYVVTPNIPTVTKGALRGLLESLDADSGYLSPADYKTYTDEKPGKAQVGLNVSKRFGYATVVSVVPGSPADKADINDGDILEAIEGHDTRDISLTMIRLMLDGAPGSKLELAVLRPRSSLPDKVTLTRTVVELPGLSESMYDNGNILYLKPQTLDRNQVSEMESKLKAWDKRPNGKVLLDLRDVSTGEVSEGVRLANFFLRSGTIATLEGQTVPKQTFTADAAKAVDPTSPLIVLVNGGTAGPAEITAAALADNKRAELVGDHTFGEGVESKVFPLPSGGALVLTVAKYAAPDGTKFEDTGIAPTVQVASAQDNALDLAAAVPATTAKNTKPAPQPDLQLNKALDLLKAKTA